MISNAIRRSSAPRPIGPCTDMSCIVRGALTGSSDVAAGMRPSVGRTAVVPQHAEGQRNEPPRSEPTPSGVIPVASAAASPPLDPPGVRAGSHGLRVGPWRALSVCQRSPRSGALVRANGIAPTARRFATEGASCGAVISASATTPCVVGEPARSMDSFTVNGTPWNGLVASPRATTASASSAADNASSTSVSVTALTSGFTASMRARCASTTSRLDATRSRMDVPSSKAPSSQSSLSVGARQREDCPPSAAGADTAPPRSRG